MRSDALALSPCAERVLGILRDAARAGDPCPTNEVLAEMTGVITQSVIRIVRTLRDRGDVVAEHRPRARRVCVGRDWTRWSDEPKGSGARRNGEPRSAPAPSAPGASPARLRDLEARMAALMTRHSLHDVMTVAALREEYDHLRDRIAAAEERARAVRACTVNPFERENWSPTLAEVAAREKAGAPEGRQ